MTDFQSFGLPERLLQAITRVGFTTPTPIQAQTIPLALAGRDILGSAQTGTGKTAAFGLPILAGLMNQPEATALILTPTRELAGQVLAALTPLIPIAGIRTALLIGGDSMQKQLRQLSQRPRLVVGTPGRVNDHLERNTLRLDKTAFFVLDETDRMLDMGFGVQIERIGKLLPKQRQTLLFSATMPANIVNLSAKYMSNPERVAVGSTTTPAAKIQQELIRTTDGEKYGKLMEQVGQRDGSIIIFVKTKHGTERLAEKLTKGGHHADAIHGDLRQRQREKVIQDFRDKKYRILVATDVAARGLDIPHIAHVVNYDLPQCPEDYIHRIGRTARAGAEGAAVNLLTPADGAKWKAIHRLIHGKDDASIPVAADTSRRRNGNSNGNGRGRSFGAPANNGAPRRGNGGSFGKGGNTAGGASNGSGQQPWQRRRAAAGGRG
ncbi:MAG: DEAD/DEAH box helicase [Holosporales bacterium]|jgi:ATP-dependent RNA helicase DeaD